LRRSTMTPSEA